MVVDTDAVEACLLAAGDERGEVRQRSPNRDSKIDADPGHLTKAPYFRARRYGASSGMRTEQSAFCPATQRSALGAGRMIGDVRLYAYVLAASAAFTRSGVIGYWRSRTPFASKNALAIAAAVAPMTSSPAPVEGSSRRCTTTAVTCGCSAKRSTGYDTQSRLVTPLLSNVTSSLSTRLVA